MVSRRALRRGVKRVVLRVSEMLKVSPRPPMISTNRQRRKTPRYGGAACLRRVTLAVDGVFCFPGPSPKGLVCSGWLVAGGRKKKGRLAIEKLQA